MFCVGTSRPQQPQSKTQPRFSKLSFLNPNQRSQTNQKQASSSPSHGPRICAGGTWLPVPKPPSCSFSHRDALNVTMSSLTCHLDTLLCFSMPGPFIPPVPGQAALNKSSLLMPVLPPSPRRQGLAGLNSPHRQSWPQIPRDPPASVLEVLGLRHASPQLALTRNVLIFVCVCFCV